jgi:pSer/pThr/pTyr-binding forkhead associated (FHA) protein
MSSPIPADVIEVHGGYRRSAVEAQQFDHSFGRGRGGGAVSELTNASGQPANLLPRPITGEELQTVIKAERANTPFLLYRDAVAHLTVVRLGGAQELTAGRRQSNDIALAWDDEVSRLHARFELVAGAWTIVDDGLSSNGTFVNAARVSARRRLHDGDAIRLGRTLLVFRNPGAETSAATREPTDVIHPPELTTTQQRVLVALCRPYKPGRGGRLPATNQKIASEVSLSVDAVKRHLRALFVKFAVQDLPQMRKRAELVERALASSAVRQTEL